MPNGQHTLLLPHDSASTSPCHTQTLINIQFAAPFDKLVRHSHTFGCTAQPDTNTH
jgi:hypothetical protein